MFPHPQTVFLNDFADDSGMATPEVSLLILVGVAFATVLLVLVQSPEPRGQGGPCRHDPTSAQLPQLMSKNRKGRRKPNDRGAATVESAVALMAFVMFLGLTLYGMAAAIDQLRCVDAAREAARLTARGEPEEGKKAAARIAPANAEITINTKGEHIEVNIRASPASGLLPGIRLHAEAFAVREPEDPTG